MEKEETHAHRKRARSALSREGTLELRKWRTRSRECSVRLDNGRKSESSYNEPSQNETLMCVYIYINTYTHTHTHTHIYIYIYVCIYMVQRSITTTYWTIGGHRRYRPADIVFARGFVLPQPCWCRFQCSGTRLCVDRLESTKLLGNRTAVHCYGWNTTE